jgi:hypothetical protein
MCQNQKGKTEMIHPQFEACFRLFCQDVLSCLQDETPKNCESFKLQYGAGLCTNFTNWCWMTPIEDPTKIANGIHYLFRELELEPAHPFDKHFSDYLKNQDKYSFNKPSNVLRFNFIKKYAA